MNVLYFYVIGRDICEFIWQTSLYGAVFLLLGDTLAVHELGGFKVEMDLHLDYVATAWQPKK